MEQIKTNSFAKKTLNLAFLIILNLTIIAIIGFMTLDSEANLNSRVGGILLSIFIPIFIVYQTKHMDGLERVVKYGFGFFGYLISSIVMIGIPVSFVTSLIPCLVIALAVLFYGNKFVSSVVKIES